MLCQTYVSEAIPHRGLEEMAGTSHLIPSALYNADILGEDGFECVDRIDGLYAANDGGALTDSGVVIATGWTRQRWWPSWVRFRWEFDAETGAFLRRDTAPGGYHAQDIYQGAGGELWLKLITGPLQLLGPDDQPSGVTLLPASFGAIAFRAVLIDRLANRIVMTPDVDRILEVRALDTGALLHTLQVPSRPRDICYEEGTRCYVLTDSRDLFVLDYLTGRWFGAVKLTALSGDTARIAWDRRYRRLLAIEQVTTPNYLNQVGITGFAMRPVITHLCAPIPLKRLRAGTTVPVLVKAVGDLGEGIADGVSVAATGPNLVAPQNFVALDGAGESVPQVQLLAAGDDVLSLSVSVPCPF